MHIEFTPNDEPTVGAELELHIIDCESGELIPATTGLLAELVPDPGEIDVDDGPIEHPRIKNELFESTIEIISEVCRTPAEVGADLATTLQQLQDAASPHGISFISAGTHPFAKALDAAISPNPRYERILERMQWTITRQIVCGLHVHVAVRDGERAIAVMNELHRHLPLFLALSASSPYFEGADSGLASTRIKLFEALPSAEMAPEFDDWSEFENYMETLVGAGCIESIKDVYWFVRPQPSFGTVEIRMFDAPSRIDDLVALVALVQALVVDIQNRMDAGETMSRPPRWMVQENLWLAARYGQDAELIVEAGDGHERRAIADLVDELVESLQPVAEQLGAESELARLPELAREGGSSARQRAVVADGGTLLDVVHHLADELVAPPRR